MSSRRRRYSSRRVSWEMLGGASFATLEHRDERHHEQHPDGDHQCGCREPDQQALPRRQTGILHLVEEALEAQTHDEEDGGLEQATNGRTNETAVLSTVSLNQPRTRTLTSPMTAPTVVTTTSRTASPLIALKFRRKS
ncbi:hypothetical protein H0B43_20260 [Rhodococcus wratislaviensis]|nr:hypothetical protein [Rhodococcus sp. 4CII]